MSFTTSNLVAVSNSNNNNNIIAASNGESFIAAVSGLIGTESPFTGAKFFKGAAPGTIKKPSAGVASMKTTVGFDGFTGVDAQVGKPSSSLRNKLFLASKPKTSHGKAGYDSGRNKKSYKDVAESGINRVGDSPQIWTR